MEHGESMRAHALAEEHVQIAKMNMEIALERPESSMKVMPAIRLIAGSV
jgi:GntR family transcriptional regulator of vanillate catabolism